MASSSTARAEPGPPGSIVAGVPVRVHLVLFTVQLTFAGFHVFGKYVLEHLSPMALAGIRVLAAAPVLLLLAGWIDGFRLPPRAELPRLALLGLLGVTANQLLFILGLSYTTATNAAILMPSIPVLTAAAAVLFRVERMTWARLAGIGSAVAGAWVLLDPMRFRLESDTTLGNLLVLLNCAAYAVFMVLQRPVLARIPPLTLVAWAYLFGGLAALPFTLGDLGAVDPGSLSPAVLLGLAYIVLVPTILNYALVTWALGKSSTSLVSTYITLQPLAAAALAAIFLGEAFGARQGLGFVFISAGLVLVSLVERRARPR